MVAVQLAAHHAEHGAEPAHHRRRQRFEHGHLEAAQAAGGGDLGTDEPGADDHHARAVVEPGAEVERVVDGTEHEDPVEVGRVRAGCGASHRLRAARRRRRASRRRRGSGRGHGRRARSPARRGAARRRARRRARDAARAPGAPTHRPAAASTAADGRTGGAARRRRARSGRRNPPGAASPWPAAPPARPPPPPRFATPASSPRGPVGRHLPKIPSLDAHRPLSRGGGQGSMLRRFRPTGTGPETRALVLGGPARESGLSTCGRSEYLLRSRVCQIPGGGAP